MKFSLEDIPYTAPESDKSIEYMSSDETYTDVAKEDCAKLVVFSYKDKKEFPAVAYLSGKNVIVESLISGMKAFEFEYLEIEKATLEKIDELEMDVVDTEFASVCVSDVGKYYEELLPEYSWEYEGMSRNQYVFESGLVITEKSMEQLRAKLHK